MKHDFGYILAIAMRAKFAFTNIMSKMVNKHRDRNIKYSYLYVNKSSYYVAAMDMRPLIRK